MEDQLKPSITTSINPTHAEEFRKKEKFFRVPPKTEYRTPIQKNTEDEKTKFPIPRAHTGFAAQALFRYSSTYLSLPPYSLPGQHQVDERTVIEGASVRIDSANGLGRRFGNAFEPKQLIAKSNRDTITILIGPGKGHISGK